MTGSSAAPTPVIELSPNYRRNVWLTGVPAVALVAVVLREYWTTGEGLLLLVAVEVAVIAAFLYYINARATAAVGPETISFARRFGTVRIDVRRIAGVRLFADRPFAGVTFELTDGTRRRVWLWTARREEPVRRVLDAIEEATGKPIAGRRSAAGQEYAGSFAEFRSELREATGGPEGNLAAWALRKAWIVQPQEIGAGGPLVRWGFHIFSLRVLFTFPLLVMAALVPTALPWKIALAALVLALWAISSLGVNFIALLLRRELLQREALEADLAAAREVQKRLLPATAPLLPGLDLASSCIPAREVGGDYFDFVLTPNGEVVIVVADVSGKGLPAALLMTMTKGALQTALGRGDALVAALESVNRTIKGSSKAMFVTMVVAAVRNDRSVTLARAGHNPPLLVDSDGATRIQPRGIALGLYAGGVFSANTDLASLTMNDGDVLVLYSDGVVEAMNAAGEEYGQERFESILRARRIGSAEEIRDAVLDDVRAFRGRAAVNDDITLLVMKARVAGGTA